MKRWLVILFVFFLFITYVAALPPLTNIVKLEPRGDDEYILEFANRQDTVYRFQYISNEGGTFKYGDDNKDLVFIEGNFSESMTIEDLKQTNAFNVGILDYIVLSNVSNPTGNDEHATTHIIRYNSIDIYDHRLSFDEEGSGTQEFIYETLSSANGAFIGKAYLQFGNNRYIAYIGNATSAGNDNPLAIDMNGDGVINRAEIRATTIKGNILDFGNAEESDGGRFTYNNGINWQCQTMFCWTNIGDSITGNTSDFTFLTKRRTIGPLPIINQPVITHITQQPDNELSITSVQGLLFTLLPPDDQRLTPYRFFFKLSTEPEESTRLDIAYRERH